MNSPQPGVHSTYDPKNGVRVEFTVFKVGNITCGLEIKNIQEINKHHEFTQVYGAPDYVQGIINLRGKIVTVINLQRKFGLEVVSDLKDQRVIIVQSGDEHIGLLVDAMEDVITDNELNIDLPPSNVRGVSGEFFSGILKTDKELISILDIQKILKH